MSFVDSLFVALILITLVFIGLIALYLCVRLFSFFIGRAASLRTSPSAELPLKAKEE